MTHKRSNVSEGLAEDLIKKFGKGEIFISEFVSKVNYRYKKNDVCYRDGQIVVKQTIKYLNVVTILTNFNKRWLHCSINKRGDVVNVM